jgi:diguanylate cyclase
VWDKVLKIFAWWLVWIFSHENVYRVGGEEFLILLDVDNTQLKAKMEDLLYALTKRRIRNTNIDQNWFKITFSAWVSKYSWEETFHELYEKVDALLYRSKKSGKNRVNI